MLCTALGQAGARGPFQVRPPPGELVFSWGMHLRGTWGEPGLDLWRRLPPPPWMENVRSAVL